jgi:hypothetical protein
MHSKNIESVWQFANRLRQISSIMAIFSFLISNKLALSIIDARL